jgi:ATP-binding cassette subfamily F protein uup
MPIVQLQGVTMAFGGPAVLDAVDLVVEPGERLALVGRNGAGKSTLLRVLEGTLEPDAGSVSRPAGMHVARLEQRVPDDIDGTVLDAVLHDRQDGLEAWQAEASISRMGLDPEAHVAQLSAGQQRRTLLARALAGEPDLLLLDEPTNHLDISTIADIEEALLRVRPTLVFVTHDRALLRRLATGILDLDRGHLTRHPADYDAYLERRAGDHATEVAQRALFDKRLAGEEAWIREGVRERRKRNMGRVARLQQARAELAVRRDVVGTVRMEAEAAARSGRIVLTAKDLTVRMGDRTLVEGFSTRVDRGDRIGIVGPNGAGKTSLIRVLLGEQPPTAGTVDLGTNLAIGYFDQLHATLDPDRSAIDNVADGATTVTVNGKERHIIGYLAHFLFEPDQVRRPIARFSGGERNRLLLARLFTKPTNVLVLDEPTNDLDVETLEVLQELLDAYEGTILMVSHDRELLEGIASRVWVLDGAGGVREIDGGPIDWRRLGTPDTPAVAEAPPAPKPRPKAAPPALDKRERKELQELPARIERLEAQLAERHAAMADPAYFRQPGVRIATAQAEVEKLAATIATAYARWEALTARAAGA